MSVQKLSSMTFAGHHSLNDAKDTASALCTNYAGVLSQSHPLAYKKKPNRQTRGHTQKLNVLTSTCDSVKNSFYVRTIPEWNNLTEENVMADSPELSPKA